MLSFLLSSPCMPLQKDFSAEFALYSGVAVAKILNPASQRLRSCAVAKARRSCGCRFCQASTTFISRGRNWAIASARATLRRRRAHLPPCGPDPKCGRGRLVPPDRRLTLGGRVRSLRHASCQKLRDAQRRSCCNLNRGAPPRLRRCRSFHLHHRIERALGGGGIGIGDRFRQSDRRNLPGQSPFVLAPAARALSGRRCRRSRSSSDRFRPGRRLRPETRTLRCA